MVRVTNAVSHHRRLKRLFKRAKGFVGDRKNHIKLTYDAVLSAMAFNYFHRKQKKRDFRKIWTARISVGAKMHELSYSKLIHGLKKANCDLNRKVLSEMAIHDPSGFAAVVDSAKKALV
ncbi:MAG: 50S ribosomal protein L20 [Rhabdochlamydiaceae bacterium]